MADALALEAQDVCKRFDGAKQDALAAINLAVKPGEFYSFLGPSGCGKTTMLRIFAGFETASSGNVLIAGRSMNGVPPNKRPVNMVFQSYALFPHLSVVENVAFGLRAKPAREAPSSADILAQAKEALAIVRLSSFGDRLPAQLSGGQQQRVALARALVMRPVVLLLDEPLSALDVQIREEMQEELSRLQRQLNITFVMVTHDQSEALALSSSVSVFNQGRIEQIGSPNEIYAAPHTAFVARFIGRSNVLSGKVVDVDSASASASASIVVELSGISKTLRCNLEPGMSAPARGSTVELCIKPEAVVPVVPMVANSNAEQAAEIESGVNILPCRLESSSYQGSLADIRLNLNVGAENAGESGDSGDSSHTVIRATVAAGLVAAVASAAAQSQLKIYLAPGDLRLLKSSQAAAEPALSEALHASVG